MAIVCECSSTVAIMVTAVIDVVVVGYCYCTRRIFSYSGRTFSSVVTLPLSFGNKSESILMLMAL